MNTLEFLGKLLQRSKQLHHIGQNINFVAERQSYLSVEFPESFVHCGSIAGGFEKPVLKKKSLFLFGDASAAEITHLIFFYLFLFVCNEILKL